MFFSSTSWQPQNLRRWLASGHDPNSISGDQSLLGDAANRGDLKSVELLLHYGADPNQFDLRRMTPLATAVRDKKVDLALILIAHHGDVERGNGFGSTPLHFAALNGEVPVLMAAAKEKADLSPRNISGLTPLDRSLLNAQLAAARFLLDHHARSGYKSLSPIHFAALAGAMRGQYVVLSVENPALRVGGPDIDKPEIEVRAPDLIRYLVKRGFNINGKGPGGWTPLQVAALGDNLDAAQALVALGADKAALDAHHKTAADLAWDMSSERVYRLLTGKPMTPHPPKWEYVEPTPANAFATS